MSDPRPDPVTFRIFNEIGIIDQLASTAFRQHMPRPLNNAMFGVLNHFVRLGDGRTPSELAAAFQVARPSMTATLDKLARAGFVDIVPDPADGRTKRVYITEAGRAARARAVEASGALLETIAPALEGVDQERLLALLQEMRKVLDAAR
ncbi:MarR family winged helix-turn-helix transcriptional regulator [Erythrobacter sp. NE805]|uniref:MarR family winged helix-turn-helix transcriptional regulator n=1 Tax=Erythrobacter sp. NE805 TaxID=3389875 RepID=UPI00396B0D71